MRLLILSQTTAYWTAIYARFFIDRGDQVLVVSVSPGAIDGVDVEFIGVEPYDKFKNKHLYFTRVPHIRRIMRRFQPDLVFASYIVSNGLSAALAWRGPLVVSGHGNDVLKDLKTPRWKQFLRDRLVRYACRRANLVHCVAQEMEDRLSAIGVAPHKILQIPLGVDIERFQPPPHSASTPMRRIICTRKHEPIYDNATLVRALAQLKKTGCDFHCTFVGGGHLLDACRTQLQHEDLADQVTLLGHTEPDQIPQLLKQADIYVSASLSDGTSSALLEAMATGLTPVVTRIPANEPWITHGQNGLLFSCTDAKGLAVALQRALTDRTLRQRALHENPLLVEQRGNLQANNQQLAQAFDALLAGQSNPLPLKAG